MILLLALPLLVTVSVDFRPIPLLVEDDEGGVQISPPATKVIEEMADGFHVTSVLEVDTRTSLSILLWRTLAGSQAKDFDVSAAPLWFITIPTPEGSRPHALLVSSLSNCKDIANSTRLAVNVMSSLSQYIFFNIPQDSITESCVPALQSLVAEADLTHRNAHRPGMSNEPNFTTDAQVNSNYITSLPPLQIVVSGGWITRGIEDLIKLEGASPFKTLSSVAVSFREKADFSYATSDIAKLGPDVPEHLARISSELTVEVQNWPKFLWLHSGQRFLVWLDHVREGVAPRINLNSTYASFAAKMKKLAIERAVQRYSYEMKGAIEYGWMIKADGSTIKAIAPSAEQVNDNFEETAALVNPDISLAKYKIRPPSEANLQTLHEAAVQRAERFARSLLYQIAEEDAVVDAVKEQIELKYKYFTAVNADKIKAYVKEYKDELKAAGARRINSLSGTLPQPRQTIDETLQRVLNDCDKDFTLVMGYLEDAALNEARQSMIRDLTKAAEKQHEVNTQLVNKHLQVCLEKALEDGDVQHIVLPLGRKELAQQTMAAEKKAMDRWESEVEQFYKGRAIWPERAEATEATKKKLDAHLTKKRKDLEGDNRVAVEGECKKKATALVREFVKTVVKGTLLPYPGPEAIVFDRAALEANTFVAMYATALKEFSDIPTFTDEMRQLENELQGKICSSVDSVMNRNVEVYATKPWIRAAMVDTERRIKANPEAREQAGLLLQEYLAQHGGEEFAAMSNPLKQRLVNYWCSINLEGDCPGNCINWSSSYPIHVLDIMGLCEPTWAFCNYHGHGKQEKGEFWKEGSSFTYCTAPEDPPCATFWDRREGRYWVKYALRAAWGVSISVALVAFILRQMRFAEEGHVTVEVKKTPGSAAASKQKTPRNRPWHR